MNSMGYLGMISVPLPHQRPEAAAESQVGGMKDLFLLLFVLIGLLYKATPVVASNSC